jgi:NitT/TauT family transport system substrate-binding protein
MAKRGFVAVSAALLVFVSACGGSDTATEPSGNSTTKPAELTKVTAGIIPISNLTPFYVAQEKGIFAKHGLQVESTSATSGGTLTSALTGGSLEFAYSNMLTPVGAQLGGIDLKIIAGQNAAQMQEPDGMALVVAKDSKFTKVADLKGQKIAINTLKNANEVATDFVLREAGVAPEDVKYVELAFPEMANALIRGDVQAANLVEPFRTLMADKLRALSYPFVEVQPGLDIAGWISSARYVEENPEVVEKFTAALAEANDYLNNDAEEKIKWTAEFTKSEPDVIRKLTLDRWVSTVDAAGFQKFVDLAVKEKVFAKSVDVKTMLHTTAVAK